MKYYLDISEFLYYICISKYTHTFYTHNKCMEKNRIEIAVTHKKELVNDFRTTMTTVQQSLDYYNNSILAQSIRRKAKSLLIAEAAKIKD